MTIKGFFFDIDDTLYSTTRFAERARRSAVTAWEPILDFGFQILAAHSVRLPVGCFWSPSKI